MNRPQQQEDRYFDTQHIANKQFKSYVFQIRFFFLILDRKTENSRIKNILLDSYWEGYYWPKMEISLVTLHLFSVNFLVDARLPSKLCKIFSFFLWLFLFSFKVWVQTGKVNHQKRRRILWYWQRNFYFGTILIDLHSIFIWLTKLVFSRLFFSFLETHFFIKPR